MKSIKKAFLLSLVLIAMVSSLFVCVAAGNKLVVAAKQYGNSEVAGAQNDFKPAKQYANQDYVLVGAGETYETLDAALAGVEDGAKIMLKAGEYTLGVVINKNVEIYGPNANVAATYVKHGFYLSIGEKFQPEALLTIPNNRLLLETDESQCSIEDVYKQVAYYKKMPMEQLLQTIGTNINQLFPSLI